MKNKLLVKNIGNTVFKIFKEIAIWIGICFSTHQTIIGFFEPIINRFSKFLSYNIITTIIYEVFMLGVLYIIIYSIYEVNKKEIIIKFNRG